MSDPTLEGGDTHSVTDSARVTNVLNRNLRNSDLKGSYWKRFEIVYLTAAFQKTVSGAEINGEFDKD